MIVLGVDPGRWVGWCVLDMPAGGDIRGARPSYVAAGVLDAEELGEARLCGALVTNGIDRAGVERVERVLARRGAFDSARATSLVTAAWLGGTVAQALRAASIDVRTPSADAVRAHFVAGVGPRERATRKAAGETANMDEVVASVCRERIAGWPERLPGTGSAYRRDGSDLLAQRRSHACDAALVALYAASLPGGAS